MVTITQATQIINNLGQTFDSHDFIEQFAKDYEQDYVNIVCQYNDKPKGAFRTAHAQIALFLSRNSTQLGIVKVKEVSSKNIKGYDSENQEWQKAVASTPATAAGGN